jgi:hypothetical protein
MVNKMANEDTSSNSANDLITENMDEGQETDNKYQSESFLAAIKEMGRILFKKYKVKTSNISYDNASGFVSIEALNAWMEKHYKYKFTSLDIIVKSKRGNVMSVKGYGIDKFIEESGSIQASYQQTDVPLNLANKLMNRR